MKDLKNTIKDDELDNVSGGVGKGNFELNGSAELSGLIAKIDSDGFNKEELITQLSTLPLEDKVILSKKYLPLSFNEKINSLSDDELNTALIEAMRNFI